MSHTKPRAPIQSKSSSRSANGHSKMFREVTNFLGLTRRKKSENLDYLTDPNLTQEEREFYQACTIFRGIQKKLAPQDKLRAYGLYKQATLGDCTLLKPSSLMRKRLLKYTAWRAQRGMAIIDAQRNYTNVVNEFRTALGDLKAPPKLSLVHAQNGKINPPKRTVPRQKPVMDRIATQKLEDALLPTNFARNYPQKEAVPYFQRPIIDRGRASVELNEFFSRKPDPKEKPGMAFNDDEILDLDGSFDNSNYLNDISFRALPTEPVPLGTRSNKRSAREPSEKMLSAHETMPPPSGRRGTGPMQLRGSVQSNRASVRDLFKATDDEYRRFTMLRVNPSVISSMYLTTHGSSFASFVRTEYEYKGPNLQDMLAQGRKEKHPIKSKSALLSQNDEKYNEVCALVHRLYVEYQESFKNGKGNDQFAAEIELKMPLDKFMFRLIRYLDRWFEEPPGINSAGARSMIISRIYIDRLKENMDDFDITRQNIFRILSVCMLLSAKFCEDCIIANAYWAQVAGVTVDELNKVEELFCNITHFDLYVKDDEFDKVSVKYGLVKKSSR